MNKMFAGLLFLIAVVFLGASEDSSGGDKFKLSASPPASFSSEKELKNHLLVDEWHDYEAGKNRYFVCICHLPASAILNDWISVWYHAPTGELYRVWDIHMWQPFKMEYNTKTSRFEIVAIANTPSKGQTVASVVLSALN